MNLQPREDNSRFVLFDGDQAYTAIQPADKIACWVGMVCAKSKSIVPLAQVIGFDSEVSLDLGAEQLRELVYFRIVTIVLSLTVRFRSRT